MALHPISTVLYTFAETIYLPDWLEEVKGTFPPQWVPTADHDMCRRKGVRAMLMDANSGPPLTCACLECGMQTASEPEKRLQLTSDMRATLFIRWKMRSHLQLCLEQELEGSIFISVWGIIWTYLVFVTQLMIIFLICSEQYDWVRSIVTLGIERLPSLHIWWMG